MCNNCHFSSRHINTEIFHRCYVSFAFYVIAIVATFKSFYIMRGGGWYFLWEKRKDFFSKLKKFCELLNFIKKIIIFCSLKNNFFSFLKIFFFCKKNYFMNFFNRIDWFSSIEFSKSFRSLSFIYKEFKDFRILTVLCWIIWKINFLKFSKFH